MSDNNANQIQPERDDSRAIKTVVRDGETVTTHGLRDQRDDENAEQRKEAFRTGRLQRFTQFNFSNG